MCLMCLRVWDLFTPKISHVFDVFGMFDVFRPLLDQYVPVFGEFDVFRPFPPRNEPHV